MVKEGYWFGVPPLAAGLVLLFLRSPVALALGGLLILLALFVFYFFRNPGRSIPMEPGVVVSPAGRPGARVSIVLAIWNVHVNRAPAAGTITRLEYKPGKFMAAWAESASLDNEQNVFTLASEYGEVVFKQIAGWVARRVVSWKKSGDTVGRGELVGLVRFGSRVDLWLPEGAEMAVRVGDHVKGGSSVIARMLATVPTPVKRDGGSMRATQKKDNS